MSNVLIGIIGVILFIGLALAGALFLGPRFQEATANSKASAISAALSQTAAAANLYMLEEGVIIPSSIAGGVGSLLVSSNHLKSTPKNGFNDSVIAAVNVDGGHDANRASYVYTDLGTDAAARTACRTIERTSGNPNADADIDAKRDFKPVAAASRRVGCFSNFAGSYQAYAPI